MRSLSLYAQQPPRWQRDPDAMLWLQWIHFLHATDNNPGSTSQAQFFALQKRVPEDNATRKKLQTIGILIPQQGERDECMIPTAQANQLCVLVPFK